MNSLLEETDIRFRTAIIGALIREGFQLDEPFPYLQHPAEILRAIHWIGTLDFGITWESFRQALLAAGKVGILVDLSIQQAQSHSSASPVFAGRCC